MHLQFSTPIWVLPTPLHDRGLKEFAGQTSGKDTEWLLQAKWISWWPTFEIWREWRSGLEIEHWCSGSELFLAVFVWLLRQSGFLEETGIFLKKVSCWHRTLTWTLIWNPLRGIKMLFQVNSTCVPEPECIWLDRCLHGEVFVMASEPVVQLHSFIWSFCGKNNSRNGFATTNKNCVIWHRMKAKDSSSSNLFLSGNVETHCATWTAEEHTKFMIRFTVLLIQIGIRPFVDHENEIRLEPVKRSWISSCQEKKIRTHHWHLFHHILDLTFVPEKMMICCICEQKMRVWSPNEAKNGKGQRCH